MTMFSSTEMEEQNPEDTMYEYMEKTKKDYVKSLRTSNRLKLQRLQKLSTERIRTE